VSRSRAQRQLAMVVLALLTLSTAGCGYHAGGQAVRLPSDLHTLYVPAFTNVTQSYRVEQLLTAAVIAELRSRTNYRVETANDGKADATLTGVVTSAYATPLTYDSVTGRVSSSVVTIQMKASLVDSKGKVLWDNPNYIYREQYEVSNELTSFFEEKSPAVQRVANQFARTLVNNILEAY
jgi:outer membrane lipopolysaccharide assembly protein LptE/RlpB